MSNSSPCVLLYVFHVFAIHTTCCLWFPHCVCLSALWAWCVCVPCLTPLSAPSCSYLCSVVSSAQLTPLYCSGWKSAAVADRLIGNFIFRTLQISKERPYWLFDWPADCDSMPCVCVAGPQEEATLGSAGWTTPEELSEQASQAQHFERLAQLCIMSKQ